MTGFEQLYASYHQFVVQAGTDLGDLPLNSVGDNLVQLTGDGSLHVFTGPHTAALPVRVTLGRPGPLDGWHAASEATLFCPRGSLSVGGLMGDFPDALRGLAVQSGLVRVRVHARNRGQADHPEQYDLFAWPVTDDAGVTTIRDDGIGYTWTPRPDTAATWALQRLLAAADPPGRAAGRAAGARRFSGEPPWCYPRVTIRRPVRDGQVPDLGLTRDGADLVLPVGDAELRFRPEPAPPATFAATVRWTTRPGADLDVPDEEPSTVELSADGLLHKGVRAEDAVPLGLLWEYLLRSGGERGYPWEPVFAAAATEATRRAAESRRHREAQELRRWGGRMPSRRIRPLYASTRLLWDLDPDLVEALDAATLDGQRAVAWWAARQACTTARLDTVDWIAEALAAAPLTGAERDAPLPAWLDDPPGAFQRLLADPRVPTTTVPGPDGRPNWSREVLAFSALLAAPGTDPLVAALEALGNAAWAHGDARGEFLTATRAEFPFLTRRPARKPGPRPAPG